MFMGIAVAPIVALIAGILILFIPRLLNYIVALYLIIIGILGLVGGFMPGMHV
jgi:general stress protein CsbA